MKKSLSIIHCSLFIFHCSLSLATCPPGYVEVDGGALYAFHPTSCPAGYSEISSPLILPSPTNGNDESGNFNYGICLVQ